MNFLLKTKMELSRSHTDTSPPNDGVNTVEVCKFVDSSRADTLLKGFSALYEHKEFTDVVLSVDGHNYPCHKNVLAISSPYFMAMFSTDLLENQQGKVKLKEMDHKTVLLVLDYIYTGEVCMTEDTVQNLLSAANIFQLISLRTGCADFMIKHVTVSNCVNIYFFAKAHLCETLAQKAKDIINRQFSTLCQEQEFLMLPCEKLIEMIRDDDLRVSTEHLVFEACLSWINFSLRERRKYLYDIMRHIRFVNISCYYFCDNIGTDSLLNQNRNLAEILDRVKYFHMLRNRIAEIDLNFLPRRGMETIRGVVIMANPHNEEGARKYNSMEILLPKSGEIKHLCKLPQSVYMPGSCISGENQIFLAGGAMKKINYRGSFTGFPSEGVSANLFLYDRSFGSWQVKAKMKTARSQFCLVMVDGTMYAIGGQGETDFTNSVEKYDIVTNMWTMVTPMPQALRCMTAVSYKGRLFVFGGESDSQIVNCAYRYDPIENTWLELPNMSCCRALAGSVVFRDKIYVIGGNTAISQKWKKELLPEHCTTSTDIFDPNSGDWSEGPELPNALCGAGVVKYGETVMVVGGEDDKSWMAGTFVLKEEGGKEYWAEGHELPTVMSTFTCVVANIPYNLIRDRDDNLLH